MKSLEKFCPQADYLEQKSIEIRTLDYISGFSTTIVPKQESDAKNKRNSKFEIKPLHSMDLIIMAFLLLLYLNLFDN